MCHRRSAAVDSSYSPIPGPSRYTTAFAQDVSAVPVGAADRGRRCGECGKCGNPLPPSRCQMLNAGSPTHPERFCSAAVSAAIPGIIVVRPSRLHFHRPSIANYELRMSRCPGDLHSMREIQRSESAICNLRFEMSNQKLLARSGTRARPFHTGRVVGRVHTLHTGWKGAKRASSGSLKDRGDGAAAWSGAPNRAERTTAVRVFREVARPTRFGS